MTLGQTNNARKLAQEYALVKLYNTSLCDQFAVATEMIRDSQKRTEYGGLTEPSPYDAALVEVAQHTIDKINRMPLSDFRLIKTQADADRAKQSINVLNRIKHNLCDEGLEMLEIFTLLLAHYENKTGK